MQDILGNLNYKFGLNCIDEITLLKLAETPLEKKEDSHELKLNDIGKVSIKTADFIFADKFEMNKANGSFILIDANTNHTVAVGFLN